ncbi:MAG: hypothetical protein ABI377_12000 [Devosia sp.]
MKKRVRRPPKGPPNLAAKALGSKIFGLKIVTPKKGYNRKLKYPEGSDPDGSPPIVVPHDVREDE